MKQFFCDWTDKKSLKELENFIREAQSYTSNHCIITLIDVHADDAKKREFTVEEAKEFADTLGCNYIEASAKGDQKTETQALQDALAIVIEKVLIAAELKKSAQTEVPFKK